jgi:hypothetical protein
MFAIPLKVGVAVSALAHQCDNPETSILTWCSTRCRLGGVLITIQLVRFCDSPTTCGRLSLRSERLYQVTVTIPIIKHGQIIAERSVRSATGLTEEWHTRRFKEPQEEPGRN